MGALPARAVPPCVARWAGLRLPPQAARAQAARTAAAPLDQLRNTQPSARPLDVPVMAGTGEPVGRPNPDRGRRSAATRPAADQSPTAAVPDQPVTGGNELSQGKPVEPCDHAVEVLSRCRPCGARKS